ncbi:ZmpA/ZmpB/ZmpC family metallo-endopeptidase [Streptococcus plurextorum]
MHGERKLHFGIRKYAVGVVSVALSASFLTGQYASALEIVDATVASQELVSQASAVSGDNSIEKGATDAGVAFSETLSETPTPLMVEAKEAPSNGDNASASQLAASETQTGESLLRSAAQEQVMATLPLDANEDLLTPVSGQTIAKVQVVFVDGTSRIEEATANNTASFVTDPASANLANSLVSEFQSINYEDLYAGLNHQERFTDGFAIEQELKKEKNGQTPTPQELADRKKQVYMDRLDMRDNFEQVKTNIETILTGVFEKSTAVTADTVKANKEKILLGLSYLDRQYHFQFGHLAAKDLILYYPEVFGSQSDALTNLITIGNVTYADLELRNNLATYQKKVAPITQDVDLIQFIENQVPRWTNYQNAGEWFKATSKAYIVESTSPHKETGLYTQLRNSSRLKNHLLPLLTVGQDSLYAISTTNTITYGAVDTYLASKTESNKTAFQDKLAYYANHQQAFLDFWYRISEQKDRLRTYEPIVVTDSLQSYSTGTVSAEQLWSKKSGSTALPGVQEFIGPMNLYMNFVRAGGQANGDSGVTLFLYKALTDDGQSVYTHELTHILDNKVWFNGYGRRTGQGAEVFARGLFEAHNNRLGTAYPPMFNLNTAYTLGDNRTQNQSPTRFQTVDDLKTYMQGILDVVYSLDYLEAQAILQQTNDDRALLLNQLTLIPDQDTKRPNQVKDQFSHITSELAASLQSVDDFVDQSLVSGRLAFKGIDTTGIAKPNDYHVVPLFEPIYAGVQNDIGSAGDVSFRRYAYEILGEYGYDGMVAYLSNQYDTDATALAAIMPEHQGNLASFKKAMFARRADRLDDLKATSQFSDLAGLESKMLAAVEQDLAKMKANKAIGTHLTNGVTAVRALKTQIYLDYMALTDEFRTSIYKDKETSRTFYVTNGLETSTEGTGTENNPYHSLSYALQQASDGDTIKLVKNVTHRQDQVFDIPKAVTIDGQGHTLTFRGSDVALGADVVFTNMTFNMIPDGSKQPTIYLSGHRAVFDKVSTTVSQLQDSLRPTIVAGARTGNPTGSHAGLLLINGDSNMRFRQIFAGNADSTSTIPVDIIIDSEFAKVDEGIDLGGQDDHVTYGRVEVMSRSSQVKKVIGANSMDNRVTIVGTRIYGADFSDIQELTLSENANLTLSDTVREITSRVQIDTGSQLRLGNTALVSVGDLGGDGKLIIPAGTALEVLGNLEDAIQIELAGFEQPLANQLNQTFLSVEGAVTGSATVSLANDYSRFAIEETNGSYRLISKEQQPQTHRVTLRFYHANQLIKTEQIDILDGQSVTALEQYLPQATTGHYQLGAGFDKAVLNGIDRSQTIDIPLILSIPMTPIVTFDQTQIQAMSLINGLDKSTYQVGDYLDLTGVRLRLTDHQGMSITIDDSRFVDFGIVVSPLQESLATNHQQVLLTLGDKVVSLPITVLALPKANHFQPQILGQAQFLLSDNLEAKTSLIFEQISLPESAGNLQLTVLDHLPQESGDYTVTVRVSYDDQSYDDVAVPLHILFTDKGRGQSHELPEGVLPPLETAHGSGAKHELPEGVLPPLETAHGSGAKHELPEGVLPPLETAHGSGAKHELPEGVLPPLETAHGSGRHELPEGILPLLDTRQTSGTTAIYSAVSLPNVDELRSTSEANESTDEQAKLPATGQKESYHLYGLAMLLMSTPLLLRKDKLRRK